MSESRAVRGIVFNIQRYCLHDGPGIRTTVFLKGCPLSCLWCSNPESQKEDIEFMGTDVVGYEITAEEVLEKVSRDKLFFDNSGGGMTLSGGDPLSQPKFTMALIEEAKLREIPVVIETCGYAKWDIISKVTEGAELVYLDIKVMDPEKHMAYTGCSNALVLENASRLVQRKNNVIVRIPVVPDQNDGVENLLETLRFCEAIGINKVELLPYHRLGESKYDRLNVPYKLKGTHTKSGSEIQDLLNQIKSTINLDVQVIQ